MTSLVMKFLSLPFRKQIKILKAEGLLTADEIALSQNDTELICIAFDRASTDKEKVASLFNAIDTFQDV